MATRFVLASKACTPAPVTPSDWRPSWGKNRGRQSSRPLRKDWELVKDKVMYAALRAKFSQNEGIKRKLLNTCEREIVEHTKNDSYRGDGGDGTGKICWENC